MCGARALRCGVFASPVSAMQQHPQMAHMSLKFMQRVAAKHLLMLCVL